MKKTNKTKTKVAKAKKTKLSDYDIETDCLDSVRATVLLENRDIPYTVKWFSLYARFSFGSKVDSDKALKLFNKHKLIIY